MKRFVLICVVLASQAAGAAPLFTQEYPVWVGDAVRTLRERGIVSAGTLPQQAINRSEMGQVLERYMRVQTADRKAFATQDELAELRKLLESISDAAEQLNAPAERLEQLEQRVDNVR